MKKEAQMSPKHFTAHKSTFYKHLIFVKILKNGLKIYKFFFLNLVFHFIDEVFQKSSFPKYPETLQFTNAVR